MNEPLFQVRIIDIIKDNYSEQITVKQMTENQLNETIKEFGEELKKTFPWESYKNSRFTFVYAIVFKNEERIERAELSKTGKAISESELKNLEGKAIIFKICK